MKKTTTKRKMINFYRMWQYDNIVRERESENESFIFLLFVGASYAY